MISFLNVEVPRNMRTLEKDKRGYRALLEWTPYSPTFAS